MVCRAAGAVHVSQSLSGNCRRARGAEGTIITMPRSTASAIFRHGSAWSDSPRALTAPIAPAGPLPEMAPVSSCTLFCHQAGFANQPDATAVNDGLELQDLYITNAVKCLPPENKPNADEFSNCRPYLVEELEALKNLRVIISLGHGAHNSLLRLFQARGLINRLSEVPFGHGAVHGLTNGLWLVGCYHTSRYNVQTGRMNSEMFLDLLKQVKTLAQGENG